MPGQIRKEIGQRGGDSWVNKFEFRARSDKLSRAMMCGRRVVSSISVVLWLSPAHALARRRIAPCGMTLPTHWLMPHQSIFDLCARPRRKAKAITQEKTERTETNEGKRRNSRRKLNRWKQGKQTLTFPTSPFSQLPPDQRSLRDSTISCRTAAMDLDGLLGPAPIVTDNVVPQGSRRR